MKIRLRKTWVKLYKEAVCCKTKIQGERWLEKTALNLKKQMKVISIEGAKFLIRSNLTAFAERYGFPKEKERIKRVFGLVKSAIG